MKFEKYMFKIFKEFQEIKNEAVKVGAKQQSNFLNS